MTLTKYQRGESIEGWNDCPVLPTNSSSSSLNSTSSKPSRKRLPRRISHNINGSQASNGSTAPMSLPTTPHIPTTPPIPPILNQNLTSSINLVQQGHDLETKAPESMDVNLDDETINLELEELLHHPTSLQEHEIRHYQNKLSNIVNSLKQDDKIFLNNVLTKVLKDPINGGEKTIIKEEILAYMMAHQGVSGWCVPLKKIVEGIRK